MNLIDDEPVEHGHGRWRVRHAIRSGVGRISRRRGGSGSVVTTALRARNRVGRHAISDILWLEGLWQAAS